MRVYETRTETSHLVHKALPLNENMLVCPIFGAAVGVGIAARIFHASAEICSIGTLIRAIRMGNNPAQVPVCLELLTLVQTSHLNPYRNTCSPGTRSL